MEFTEKELGLIYMCLQQQQSKMYHRHKEYLAIDPEYDGPMVGQSIYDNITNLLEKLSWSVSDSSK